ncbi:hypothetical protein Tco_1061871 [Tanacetum coccineum]
MSTYFKNMAGYKHNQLKSKSYDEIHEMFDKEMKRVNTFVNMNTELVKGGKTKAEDSSKRAVKDDEVAIDAIPLATKPPMIVEYKIVKEGQKGFYHLIRADGSSKSDEGFLMKKLEDLEDEHQFRGGLLGLKDFKMILRVTTAQVTHISQKDKNKAKRTKPSTGMERAWKSKAKGIFIFNGPTRTRFKGRLLEGLSDMSDINLAMLAILEDVIGWETWRGFKGYDD